MTTNSDADATHGRDGALEALREVAVSSGIESRFGHLASAFEDSDLDHLASIAWRHQFEDDRTKFKREVRALEEVVSRRILDILELGQE